jgi:hypothetical protein
MTHRELLGISRYVGQFDVGMPEGAANESLELFLAEVLPAIHAEGGDRENPQEQSE